MNNDIKSIRIGGIIVSTALDDASERLLNDDPADYESLDDLMAWVFTHVQCDLERVHNTLKND